MGDKFIALRREPRTERAQRAPSEMEDIRAALVERAPREETPERLTDLGLVPVDVCEEAPEVRHSFQKLAYLDAYVVETPSSKMECQAREVLDEEYMIVPNFELSLPTPTVGRSYARKPQVAGAWPDVSGVKLAHDLGITGEGVTVCVLDTGVDADHRELRRKVIDFRYIPLNTAAGRVRDCRGFDVDGHGTHVAGIIAGETIGVAPNVDLMVAAVLESETLKTSLERVVVALDWLLSQFEFEENLGKAVIVNMSLGFSKDTLSRKEYAKAVTGLRSVIDTLVDDFGVLPITAVGNEGKGKVRAPAYFPHTLSVGAVDYALDVAVFSGSGTSPITNEAEPNLMGYGVDVTSSYERDRYNRSHYRALSGTSMATPYVTGIAALYAAADPALQGQALWDRLMQTALPIDGAAAGRAGNGLARFVKEAPA